MISTELVSKHLSIDPVRFTLYTGIYMRPLGQQMQFFDKLSTYYCKQL